MPSALHPQAKFDPIPPDLDISALVEKTPNFDYVIRISVDQIHLLGLAEFEKLVLLHVVVGGRPLVVEGWQSSLPPWLFSATWLQDNVGKKQEKVRDIGNGTEIPMTIGHYLTSMEKLTRQWTPTNFRDPKRQRLYLKDIDCPDAWLQHLTSIIPQTLFYLNDCVGEKGGPGAVYERDTYNQLVLGQGIAPTGDLMSSLPPEMRAENMMCYIGHEGTYTPAHREMCASLGQNIMVETSDVEKGEKPGSSIWFMTESKDREVVSEYFLSMLGHDIEVESHFAQINAWKKAPFAVYVVEQKAGDFILIPPLAPHQVWNRGTRTMKAAWNRTTVETLELAIHEALPRARMVCRDEQYKNKAIIYYTLLKYYDQLKRVDQLEEGDYIGSNNEPIRYSGRVRQLQKDFKRLFALYTEVLVSEMFSPNPPHEKSVEFLPFDSNVTCSYCRCNIFNRFLTCKTCIGELENGEEDTYDICMDCYAMGRSCGCISNLKWVEQWKWPVLVEKYDDWRHMVILNDGLVNDDSPPQSLEVARERYGKKSIAQVCQEQLKLRPWHDISKPVIPEPLPGDSDVEPEADEEGRPKRKKASKRKSDQLKKSHMACHVCRKHEWLWKLAVCTTCTNAYCYGSLWRAFDMKPESVMEKSDWQCPKCLKICSCGACRRITTTSMVQIPYRPKGTLLGHDTRRVADPRSVESLVDFSRTNLFWLKDDGDNDPQSSSRMQKLVEKAKVEKERDDTLGGDFEIEDNGIQTVQGDSSAADLTAQNFMAIDPQLRENSYEMFVPESANHYGPSNLSASNGSGPAFSNGTHTRGKGQTTLHTMHTPHSPMHKTLVEQTKSPGVDNQPGFMAPRDRLPEESLYPDPSNVGRERMMGIGYYKQANDADKILFDGPEAGSPTGENPNSSYPRLPQADENRLEPNSKKRKRFSVDGAELDEAHLQFLQVQKKQKLDQARKNGTFFMTRNQLEGGGSLTVKLPMMNRKEFLERLDQLDSGRKSQSPRHNPLPARTSVAAPSRNADFEEDLVIVRSDVQENVDSGTNLEDSDNDDDNVKLANRALRKLTNGSSVESPPMKSFRGPSASARRVNVSDVRSNQKSSPVAEKVKPSRRTSPPLGRRNAEQETSPTISAKKSTNERRRVTFSEPAQEKMTTAEIAAIPDTDLEVDTSLELDPVVTPPPSETSSDHELAVFEQEETFVLVDENYIPITPSPKPVARPVKSASIKAVSDEYQSAKLMALRMAEGEIDDEIPVRPTSGKAIAASGPAKKSSNSVPVVPVAKVVSLSPSTPPKKLISMAERRAAQGKSFKIVAAKSPKANSSASKPSPPSNAVRPILKPGIVQKSLSIARVYPTKDLYDSDGSSSSDDDEEIPAVRPNTVTSRGFTPVNNGLRNR